MEIVQTEQEIVINQEQLQRKYFASCRHRKKPKDIKELERRIDEFFAICDRTGMIPSIEGLSLALGVSRQTVLRWYRGQYCSLEWTQKVLQARQAILAYNEQRLLNGDIHPAAGIFWLKAAAGWRDDRPLEAEIDNPVIEAARPVTQMLTQYKQVLGIADSRRQAECLPDVIAEDENEVIMFR